MKSVVGRGVMAGVVMILAGTSMGQNLALSVMFSIDRGSSWSNSVFALGGQVVMGRISMSGDGVYGLGGATLRLTATGGVDSDNAVFAPGTDTGRVGPFNFGAATNAIYSTSDGFRIDAASDASNSNTGAGMTFFQRDPASGGAGFSTANPATVFRFDIQIGFGDFRAITLRLDELSRGVGSYYTSSNATRPTTASVTLNSGTILASGVPTPGAASVVALAGVMAGRRRRGGI